MKPRFTWLGIILAIVLFPIGLICLFGSQEERCDNCGAVV